MNLSFVKNFCSKRRRNLLVLTTLATVGLILFAGSTQASGYQSGSHSNVSARVVLGVPGLVGFLGTFSGKSPMVLQLGVAGGSLQSWIGSSIAFVPAPDSWWKYDWQVLQLGAAYGYVVYSDGFNSKSLHFAVASTFRALREVAFGFGFEFFGQVGVGKTYNDNSPPFPQVNIGIGIYR